MTVQSAAADSRSAGHFLWLETNIPVWETRLGHLTSTLAGPTIRPTALLATSELGCPDDSPTSTSTP